MAFCPFSQRVRLVLTAKKAPFDVVNINLKEKPEWLTTVNPQGKVPALDDGGKIIVDSVDIADYLDSKYPDPPLWPADPEVKARHKKLLDDFGKVMKLYHEAVFEDSTRPLPEYVQEISEALTAYEEELAAGGGTFFGGNKPGMLDYLIWPWAERAKLPSMVHKQDMNFPKDKFPKLVEWRGAMKDDRAVRATGRDSETHARFALSYVAGSPDFDL